MAGPERTLDCPEVWEVLEEYRRGELAADATAAVGAHLARCPACRRLLESADALAARLRALPRPAAPPTLVQAVRALAAPAPAPPRRRPARWLAAAAAVVVLAGLAGGALVWLRERDRPAAALEAVLESGVAEHRRIAMLAEGSPDVDDPSALFREVERLSGIPLPPVFAGTGDLRLRDARATVLAGRKSAAAALRYPSSPITTYFLLPGEDLPMPSERRVQIDQYRPYMRRVSGYNVIYWKQKNLAYLMVSGLDAEGCQKLFLTMRRAL